MLLRLAVLLNCIIKLSGKEREVIMYTRFDMLWVSTMSV